MGTWLLGKAVDLILSRDMVGIGNHSMVVGLLGRVLEQRREEEGTGHILVGIRQLVHSSLQIVDSPVGQGISAQGQEGRMREVGRRCQVSSKVVDSRQERGQVDNEACTQVHIRMEAGRLVGRVHTLVGKARMVRILVGNTLVGMVHKVRMVGMVHMVHI